MTFLRKAGNAVSLPASLLIGGALFFGCSSAPPNTPYNTAQVDSHVPAPPPSVMDTNPPITKLSATRWRVGKVVLDKADKSLTFPAVVNMVAGPLEYLLVTDWGKVHESALRTPVDPYQIHVAMLLLSPKVAASQTANNNAPVGGGQIENPSSEALPGERVSVQVSWEVGGRKKQHGGEELVYNLDRNAIMRDAIWVYTGSRLVNGNYMGQITGSIISLITDPDAQINSETKGHDNDRIWNVNTNLVPVVNTPVTITVRLNQTEK
jgi:hypothetical protein